LTGEHRTLTRRHLGQVLCSSGATGELRILTRKTPRTGGHRTMTNVDKKKKGGGGVGQQKSKVTIYDAFYSAVLIYITCSCTSIFLLTHFLPALSARSSQEVYCIHVLLFLLLPTALLIFLTKINKGGNWYLPTTCFEHVLCKVYMNFSDNR
jgi:hypothetical protein